MPAESDITVITYYFFEYGAVNLQAGRSPAPRQGTVLQIKSALVRKDSIVREMYGSIDALRIRIIIGGTIRNDDTQIALLGTEHGRYLYITVDPETPEQRLKNMISTNIPLPQLYDSDQSFVPMTSNDFFTPKYTISYLADVGDHGRLPPGGYQAYHADYWGLLDYIKMNFTIFGNSSVFGLVAKVATHPLWQKYKSKPPVMEQILSALHRISLIAWFPATEHRRAHVWMDLRKYHPTYHAEHISLEDSRSGVLFRTPTQIPLLQDSRFGYSTEGSNGLIDTLIRGRIVELFDETTERFMKSLLVPVTGQRRTECWKFNPIPKITTDIQQEFDTPVSDLVVTNMTILTVLFEHDRIEVVDRVGIIYVFQSLQYPAWLFAEIPNGAIKIAGI